MTRQKNCVYKKPGFAIPLFQSKYRVVLRQTESEFYFIPLTINKGIFYRNFVYIKTSWGIRLEVIQ